MTPKRYKVSISQSDFAEVTSEAVALEDLTSRGSLCLPARKDSLESFSFETFPTAEKRPSFKPLFKGFTLRSFHETLFTSSNSLRGKKQMDSTLSSTTSIVTENGEIELFE